MNPTNDEVDEALQRLDRVLEPPRILAAKAVAEYRGERTGWPIKTTDSGAPLLDRDAVLHRTEPQHAPNVSRVERRSLWLRLLGRR